MKIIKNDIVIKKANIKKNEENLYWGNINIHKDIKSIGSINVKLLTIAKGIQQRFRNLLHFLTLL